MVPLPRRGRSLTGLGSQGHGRARISELYSAAETSLASCERNATRATSERLDYLVRQKALDSALTALTTAERRLADLEVGAPQVSLFG